MTEDQYTQICALTDEILNSKNANVARTAIPWLHVIRAHPVFLKKYQIIFDNKIIVFLKKIKRIFLNLTSIFVVLVQSIWYSRNSNWLKRFKKDYKLDILFLSHLINESQINLEDDFYFSDLPKKTSIDGYKSLVVMINHKVKNSYEDEKNLSKLVLPYRLGFFEELKNLKLLWAEFRALKREMRVEKNFLKKNILNYAAIESLSNSSLFSLRLRVQITELLKKFEPKILISTYEGNAWERIVFNASRNIDKNILCIGYTHAPIFEKQHAIKRSLAKSYNPEVILNSGIIQKEQLENYGMLDKTVINVLGSIRCFDRKLNSDTPMTYQKLDKRIKQTCLVVPEGIDIEIDLLFEFSISCAKEMPNCEFIWRLHPLFNFKKIISKNIKYWNLPKNIILSSNSLEEDFNRSQWVLYRASSVVIQAVTAGLKPIYLHKKNEMKIDPIYEINQWKSEVESIQDFKQTLDLNRGDYSQYDEAKKYCADIYSPLNKTLLSKFLEEIISNE